MSESEEKFNDLVPVHGGLEQPVDRRVALSERKAFLKERSPFERRNTGASDYCPSQPGCDHALKFTQYQQ